MKFTKRQIIIIGAILVLFFALRLPAINQPYHQDEYRWASIANPEFSTDSSSHPPLTKVLLWRYGDLFNYDTLRVIPLIFSVGIFVLLFCVVLRITGLFAVSAIATFLYSISSYSIIASLQVDIDGAILPFFVLLTYFSYLKIQGRDRYAYLMLTAAIVGGFMAKLSYFLVLVTVAVDWALNNIDIKRINWKKNTHKLIIIVPWLILVAIGGYFLLGKSHSTVFEYASHFKVFNFGERAYGDMGFKVIKSILLISPMFILSGFLGLIDARLRKQYRFWWLYIFINTVFYLAIFDFTRLTIERYLMFLVVPLCLIGAPVIFSLVSTIKFQIPRLSAGQWMTAGFAAYLMILVLALPHDVLPLNPKGEYINRLLSLTLNFLIPFTGGSGPVGFYFPALGTGIMWLASVLTVWAIATGKYRKTAAVIFVIIGIFYNILFSLEYASGFLYGSVPNVVRAAVNYVSDNPDIKEVITYYDHGAYYLLLSGKYSARFYTAPTRDYSERINSYRGHYLIVDFPAIDKNSAYWSLISRCPIEKKFSSGYVNGYIFDCTVLE